MSYHFVITLQLGPGRFSWDGIHEALPGETRQEAFREILNKTRIEAASRGIHAAAGDFSTLFFSLEPNALTAVAA